MEVIKHVSKVNLSWSRLCLRFTLRKSLSCYFYWLIFHGLFVLQQISCRFLIFIIVLLIKAKCLKKLDHYCLLLQINFHPLEISFEIFLVLYRFFTHFLKMIYNMKLYFQKLFYVLYLQDLTPPLRFHLFYRPYLPTNYQDLTNYDDVHTKIDQIIVFVIQFLQLKHQVMVFNHRHQLLSCD